MNTTVLAFLAAVALFGLFSFALPNSDEREPASELVDSSAEDDPNAGAPGEPDRTPPTL